MHNAVTNPYLPSWEYVPDGEPHVFGDRLYIFGSHDRFGGKAYCENDYVLWSAPTNDLLTGFATVLFTVAIKIRTAEARRVTCGHRMLQKVQTDGSTSITEPILTTA